MKDFGHVIHELLFSKVFGIINAIALVIIFFLPSNGFGFSTCGMQNYFNLPCPGCGMTRSLTSALHLQFADSFTFHPFGILLALIMLLFSTFSFYPENRRAFIKNWFIKHSNIWVIIYLFAVALFLLFGIVRLCWLIFSPETAGWLHKSLEI